MFYIYYSVYTYQCIHVFLYYVDRVLVIRPSYHMCLYSMHMPAIFFWWAMARAHQLE
jgi:hypothetical protein